jgi:hypothetical protein
VSAQRGRPSAAVQNSSSPTPGLGAKELDPEPPENRASKARRIARLGSAQKFGSKGRTARVACARFCVLHDLTRRALLGPLSRRAPNWRPSAPVAFLLLEVHSAPARARRRSSSLTHITRARVGGRGEWSFRRNPALRAAADSANPYGRTSTPRSTVVLHTRRLASAVWWQGSHRGARPARDEKTELDLLATDGDLRRDTP